MPHPCPSARPWCHFGLGRLETVPCRVIRLFLLLLFALLLPGCSPAPTAGGPAPAPHATASFDVDEAYQQAGGMERRFQLPQARRLYEEIADKAPPGHEKVMRARAHLGKIYYWMGEYEPAIRELKAVLASSPENSGSARANLVLCYLASDRPAEAARHIQPDIDEYSRWGTRYSFLAQARYAQYLIDKDPAHLQRMKMELREGSRTARGDYARLMLQGSLHLVEGSFPGLLDCLKKAIPLAPEGRDRISTLFMAGALERMTGQGKEGQEYFRRVVQEAGGETSLDRQSFLDWIFAGWAMGNPPAAALVREMAQRLPGGAGEPELTEFISRIEGLASASEAKDWPKALECLDGMEKGIADESVEGDYLFHAIYKPFIMGLIFREKSRLHSLCKEKEKAAAFGKRAAAIQKPVFPPAGDSH